MTNNDSGASPTASTTETPENTGSRVAFFDLGGSIIKGSAIMPLGMAAAKAGFVSKRDLIGGLRSGVSLLRKGGSTDTTNQIRDRILGIVRGRSRADVMALGEQFLTRVLADLRPVARSLLQEHQVSGEERVIISAAPTEIVERLAQELQIEHGFGTSATVDINGRYTGTLDGPFCHQSGKAQVMQEQAEKHGWDLSECFAYAGSMASLPMLEAVGHPRVVAPDRQLRVIAERRGWPILA